MDQDVRLKFQPKPPVGVTAFGSLRAEDEPWLKDCFVPPADFELMGRMYSIVVFGTPGSGKSAVREMLTRRCQDPSHSPNCLIARWQPMPPVSGTVSGFQSATGQIAWVFDACAMAVLEHLAYRPESWAEAPGWTQRMLSWFVHRFVQGDLSARAGQFLESQKETKPDAVRMVLSTEPTEDLLPPHNWPLVAAELSKALTRIGLDGMWVVVDGVEPWVQTQFERITSALCAFFSTLPLFEQADFVYKAFLPAALQPHLASAAGLERHRVHPHRLTWREAQLIQMVERRLALMSGEYPFPLDKLCTANDLLSWLRRGGGDKPRAWLELIRPLVTYYASQNLDQPIGEDVWKELRLQSPPRLSIDESHRQAFVGGRIVSVEEMTSGGFRLLCYLYKNAGRIVPWDELYFRGYRGLEHTPRSSGDEGYEPPALYEHTLHSRMSDLRKAIEPDPGEPIYFNTIRGKGVILKLMW